MSLDSQIDEMIHEYVSDDGPGVAVVVMDDDDPVLIKSYGNARLASPDDGIAKQKFTDDTVFDLASVSKQFTAIAILMLIDQTTKYGPNQGKYEKLHMSSPLSDYFPELPRATDITIQNLLNHSSDLPDYLGLTAEDQWYDKELNAKGYWYAHMAGRDTYLTNSDVIALITRQRASTIHPRTKFEYSNTGYVILAEIIRKITGKHLRAFLEEEVFEPLEMQNTFVYDETAGEFTKHSLCYNRIGTEYQSIEGDTPYNFIHGDGNIHTTLDDMIKWQQALNRIDPLPKVSYRCGVQLISKNTFFRVFRPLINYESAIRYQPGRFGYSAGFHIYRFRNPDVTDFALHHGGEWLGFQSTTMRGQVHFKRPREGQPTWKRINVIVLSNLFHVEGIHPGEIAQNLAQITWRSWGLPLQLEVLRYVE